MNPKFRKISAKISQFTLAAESDFNKIDPNRRTPWTPGGLHWFLGGDGHLTEEGLDQHLDALLRSKGITLKHIREYAKSGKKDVVNTLVHHLDKFPPGGWWDLVPAGANSMAFIKAFRRGMNRAPADLMDKHYGFVHDEFMKTSDKPGSAKAAQELSKWVPNKEFTGIGKSTSESKELGSGWVKETFLKGNKIQSEIIDPIEMPAAKIVEVHSRDLPSEISKEMLKMIPDLAKKK
jgi:hypothetical protein